MDIIEYIASKSSKMEKLVFIIFQEGSGYYAIESLHSMMVNARNKSHLIEVIKREVSDCFEGKFNGKIVLREFKDEEIVL